MLCTDSLLLTLVNFDRWKWACKMRRWGPRPRHSVLCSRRERDRDLPGFSRDRDETETFQKHVSRPSRLGYSPYFLPSVSVYTLAACYCWNNFMQFGNIRILTCTRWMKRLRMWLLPATSSYVFHLHAGIPVFVNILRIGPEAAENWYKTRGTPCDGLNEWGRGE